MDAESKTLDVDYEGLLNVADDSFQNSVPKCIVKIIIIKVSNNLRAYEDNSNDYIPTEKSKLARPLLNSRLTSKSQKVFKGFVSPQSTSKYSNDHYFHNEKSTNNGKTSKLQMNGATNEKSKLVMDIKGSLSNAKSKTKDNDDDVDLSLLV